MKKNLKLEKLEVYQLSMEIGEEVWKIVLGWDYFSKDTVLEKEFKKYRRETQ